MKRPRLTRIASSARDGEWRGVLCALVAVSLLIDPIRPEQPPPATGVRISEHAVRQVAEMRRRHGVDGTGVGIGVLSSGVAALLTGEASGELLDRVTILPGQAGEGDDGTATLAILHDLAPGAELYFATGLGGPARFAANLEALCQTGAGVIVDDLFDYQKTIYQGGLMAQAVNAAVRSGCVYVSAASNRIQSNAWEGEFAPDQSPAIADELSTTGDSAGPDSDLSGATCVTAAIPDVATFCVSTASPPQAAAMVALILESVGGSHNTSLEKLRAAVTGGGRGNEAESTPLNVATGPAVRKIEISSNPPEGRETYGIGDAIEVTVTFSRTVNVTGIPQLELRVGNVTKQAGYSGGTGTPSLLFTYTVAEGDQDSDGLSLDAGRLSLNGGVNADSSELSHFGLPDQSGHRVDAVRPSLVVGDAMVSGSKLTLTYDELLDGSSTPRAKDFRVTVAGQRRDVTTVAVIGTNISLTLASSVVQGRSRDGELHRAQAGDGDPDP